MTTRLHEPKMKIFAIVIPVLLLASCGTTKLSSDDLSEFDSGRKAIVKTYNQPLLAGMVFGDAPVVKIIAVDGKKLGFDVLALDEQIALEIGIHEIEFSCSDRAGYNEKDFKQTIELTLKPHHEYLVDCAFDSYYAGNSIYEGRVEVKEQRVK